MSRWWLRFVFSSGNSVSFLRKFSQKVLGFFSGKVECIISSKWHYGVSFDSAFLFYFVRNSLHRVVMMVIILITMLILVAGKTLLKGGMLFVIKSGNLFCLICAL